MFWADSWYINHLCFNLLIEISFSHHTIFFILHISLSLTLSLSSPHSFSPLSHFNFLSCLRFHYFSWWWRIYAYGWRIHYRTLHSMPCIVDLLHFYNSIAITASLLWTPSNSSSLKFLLKNIFLLSFCVIFDFFMLDGWLLYFLVPSHDAFTYSFLHFNKSISLCITIYSSQFVPQPLLLSVVISFCLCLCLLIRLSICLCLWLCLCISIYMSITPSLLTES